MPEWAFESPSDSSGLLSHFLWQVVLASLSPSSKLLMLCIRFPKSRAEPTNLGDWLAFACAVPFMRNAPSIFLHQSPIHSPDVTSSIHVCMSSLICSSHCVLLGDIFKVFGHSPLPPVSFHCILILSQYLSLLEFIRYSLLWRPWGSRTEEPYLAHSCIPGGNITQCLIYSRWLINL